MSWLCFRDEFLKEQAELYGPYELSLEEIVELYADLPCPNFEAEDEV